MHLTAREFILIAIALAVGAAAFFLSALVMHDPNPAANMPQGWRESTTQFGDIYRRMSEDPFGCRGIFPHRVLMPLAASVTGLAGDGFWKFHHGCSILFLALLFYFGRKKGLGTLDAALITVALAFSGLGQTYKDFAGYPDLIVAGFMLIALLWSHRAWVFWCAIGLGMLAHEQIVFFLPWMFLQRRRNGGSWRSDFTWGGGVLLAYVIFRVLVRQGIKEGRPTLTLEWYLDNHYWPFGDQPLGAVGLSIVGILAIALYFGPLLTLTFWATRRRTLGADGLSMVVLGLTYYGIFGVAHDVQRFAVFFFLPVLYASIEFLRYGGWKARSVYALAGTGGALLYLALSKPAAAVVGEGLHRCGAAKIPGILMDMDKMVTCVIPGAIWTFVAGVALFYAFASTGWFLGRIGSRH